MKYIATIQHHLQNTININTEYNNQICVGKSVNMPIQNSFKILDDQFVCSLNIWLLTMLNILMNALVNLFDNIQ